MNISFSNSDLFLSCSSSSNTSFESFDLALSDQLDDAFSGVPKNFNVVHINAQSIPAHYPDMLATFNNNNLHAILISETFLNPILPSTSYSLPGFQLIRNDRVSSSHGGVAIYLRYGIPFSIISRSPQPPPTNSAEYLFLEVTMSRHKIVLGVFYSPSLKVDYFATFETLLEDMVPIYDHIIVMGDFNTCLLKRDRRSNKLNSIVNSVNMHILPLAATHHFPNCSPSLLDLMMVSSPNFVMRHGQLSADAFSYHDLVFLSYQIRPPKIRSRVQLRRSFAKIDLDRLREDAAGIDWSIVFATESVDEQVERFNSLLIDLYDVHAPVRPVKLKHLPAPWLTDDIRSLMLKRNRAKARFRVDPTKVNEVNYHRIRNKCNTVIRDAQRRHIHHNVENGDPARIWKFLRSLGVGKPRNVSPSSNLNLNLLNNHFSSPSTIDGHHKTETIKHLSSLPTPNYSSFVFSQFTDRDVEKAIQSITSGAVGSDLISRNMLLPILDILVPVISNILNTSISTSTFPTSWKDAMVIPLPKKPNPSMFSDYRPISILPFLAKVLEKLIHRQLIAFLNTNNLLNPLQSGFRMGHSTSTALIRIADDIRCGMDKRLLTILTLLDFSNAFNSVDFEVLLSILSSLNISPAVVDWFQSYLLGRRQRICIEDSFSAWCSVDAGVPQGGVLSPLLFSIFINSITDNLSCSYHLYADDLQIYTQSLFHELSSAVSVTNDNLSRISSWSKRFGLTINPLKTQCIIIGSSYFISRIDFAHLPLVTFDGTHLTYAKTVKNLGVIFDQCFTWRPQVEALSRKVFAAYRSLNRLRNFLPISTKINLARSLILSILDYADVCYPDLSEDLLGKLERLQNIAIRFIFNLRKFDHVSDYRIKLNWLPIRFRRDLHILKLLYSTLFYPNSPLYLRNCFSFHFSSLNRTLRSSSSLALDIPPHSSDFMSYSFTVHAVRLWNSIPDAIRRARSLESFGNLVRGHLSSRL
jgi:exonuclease III